MNGRAIVFICPVCSCVKKFSEWVSYESVRQHLAEHQNEWRQVDYYCPDHKEEANGQLQGAL